MNNYICTTCGTQFAETQTPPEHCPICTDERQYVSPEGQNWTTLSALQTDHHNRIEKQDHKLYGIGIEPSFGIGQRALLIQSAEGNVLWDCISLVDDDTIEAVNALGGISAIAISHPHYYSAAIEWAHAFNVSVYLHAADRIWVMRPDSSLVFWDEETLTLNPSITLIRTGGHFDGGTVCHWSAGSQGTGTLLTGDIIQVVADKRWVSFMYSYPNLIPLPANKVKRIVEVLKPYAFEKLYGAWWKAIVVTDAKNRVKLSAERYVNAISE
ncbi:MAG: MBL fold metallo-hydrolase [Phormidesmis sp.]